MPVYAYRCQNCGVQFERTQKFADKPLTRCPECRTGTVHRVLQPPAIVFKGSGWYSTDHRSPSGQSSFHKDKAESEGKKAESSADKKTESATEKKAESKKAETASAASTASTTSESKPAKKE
jgi:putative FmdB family regulatory protein